MEKHYDIVLFDLDGTLCETGEGIKTSLRWTFQQLGRPAPDEELLRRFIGPPMRDSFMDFCGMTSTQTEEAVRLFRSHYNETGWLLTRLYPGMQALLCRLREAGARLSTATAKPENMAKRILQHFGVSACFTAVVGALPNGERAVKKELIPYALEQCGYQPGESVVMVGDTHFDAQGARETGVDFIGVLYGYGTRAELEAQGATVLAPNVEALGACLLG